MAGIAVRPETAAHTASRRALAILLLAYIFNFVDRQIVGILALPIKAELGLSDTQLGLMGGLAFALFYTGLGIPVAWLADRKGRARVIAISLAVWSLFTALCGAAQNFAQLFAARMGVGIGEAGGVAPSYALIADLFPKERRARALAIFSLGIPIGSALGIFFGGWISTQLDWRAAFVIVGLAGLLVAPLVKWGIDEPAAPERASGPAGIFGSIGVVARIPTFWLLALAAGLGSIPGYGLLFWLPSFFGRSFALSLVEVSLYYGSIVLIGGVAGIWFGGWLGDRLAVRHPAAFPLIPAVCFLAVIPAYALGLFAPSLALAFPLFLLPQALGLVWLGPVLAAIQQIVPAALRATASAMFLFVNNLLGLGFGTFIFGLLSDHLTPAYGADALRHALLYGLVFYLLAATLYAATALRFAREGPRA